MSFVPSLVILFSSLFWIFTSGCGAATSTGENYGDIFHTTDGLNLTQNNHRDGFGRSDCTACHNLNNIHLVDRSGEGFDMKAIQDQTFEDGEASCGQCHGTNGL